MFQIVRSAYLRFGSSNSVKFLTLLILFNVQVLLHYNLRFLETPSVEPEIDKRVKWDPGLTRAVSFGFVPAMIDWLWMSVLLDSNISKVQPGTHPQLYYDLDLITDLDPSFLSGYITGGNLLSVIRNDGVGARDLLLKGVAQLGRGTPGVVQQ
ncbi:MAG: hypothetical protein HYX41_04050, partial [Bdellovibrio sp.]|nr:hypothetical protein [Bdellovibrio sp.]